MPESQTIAELGNGAAEISVKSGTDKLIGIAKSTQSNIAAVTQEAPYGSGAMVVVNDKVFLLPTETAASSLFTFQGFQSFGSKPVKSPKSVTLNSLSKSLVCLPTLPFPSVYSFVASRLPLFVISRSPFFVPWIVFTRPAMIARHTHIAGQVRSIRMTRCPSGSFGHTRTFYHRKG